MNSEIPSRGKRMPMGEDVVVTPPNHGCGAFDTPKRRAQVKRLYAIGEQYLCHVSLCRPQDWIGA